MQRTRPLRYRGIIHEIEANDGVCLVIDAELRPHEITECLIPEDSLPQEQGNRSFEGRRVTCDVWVHENTLIARNIRECRRVTGKIIAYQKGVYTYVVKIKGEEYELTAPQYYMHDALTYYDGLIVGLYVDCYIDIIHNGYQIYFIDWYHANR